MALQLNLFKYNPSVSLQSMILGEEIKRDMTDFLKNNKVNVCLLTPCYGSICFTQYVTCLVITIDIFKHLGIDYSLHFCNSDSLVPRARNNMIAKAMFDPTTTHMIFIDADIEWNPSDILKLILANKGIVGGIYPLKHLHFEKLLEEGVIDKWKAKKESTFMKNPVEDELLLQNCLLKYNFNAVYGSNSLEVENDIAEVRHLATGFMMIKREVIECMQKAFPSTKYEDDIGYLTQEEKKHAFALFDCSVEDKHYYSEDWLFCQRWINMGGKIYADISINLTHIGIHSFKGSFINSLI